MFTQRITSFAFIVLIASITPTHTMQQAAARKSTDIKREATALARPLATQELSADQINDLTREIKKKKTSLTDQEINVFLKSPITISINTRQSYIWLQIGQGQDTPLQFGLCCDKKDPGSIIGNILRKQEQWFKSDDATFLFKIVVQRLQPNEKFLDTIKEYGPGLLKPSDGCQIS